MYLYYLDIKYIKYQINKKKLEKFNLKNNNKYVRYYYKMLNRDKIKISFLNCYIIIQIKYLFN